MIRPSPKPAAFVELGARIHLKPAPRYVSRGGFKLEKALQEFAISVKVRRLSISGHPRADSPTVCSPMGARGFSPSDVGYGQLDWKLRNDPRVVVLEKTNIRYLNRSALAGRCELATVSMHHSFP
jgi:23S rRNA (cytidine1920-2'-O)/16S rRNA (cytidine1409-2'-O)-methyltransferase